MNPVSHLTPDRWAHANRLLVRKALAEFTHERLLAPEHLGDGAYRLVADDGATEYRFTARRYALDHWQVAAESISRHRDGARLPLDALEFVIEMRGSLGLSDEILPVYLEEISSTLSGTAYKSAKPVITAAELAEADFQAIETGMTEGHPCFVANNGRLGFGIDEYHAYAPEAANPLRLVWLAARRDRAAFTAGAGIDYETFIRAELGDDAVDRFAKTLADRGLDLADYLLMPAHPWQWWNKLSVTFAAEIAQQRLVYLGEGDDRYLAQQSIRTFFNTDAPAKHYVKTALSVLNMGFMRGLSAAYMEATPAINDWLAGLIDGDDVLKAARFSIIRERAAVGYRHLEYEGRDRPVLPLPQDARRPVAREPGGVPGGRRAARHHGVPAARRRRGRVVRGRADRPIGPGAHRVAARLPGRLPAAGAAQLLRVRPGLHAARRERHPGARRRRHGPAGDLQGHRGGDRGDGPGRGAAAVRRPDPGGGAGGDEDPLDLH
ncbi:siderophore synthetase component [Streptomyces pristinaespiralis]